MLILQ
jgi:galacturan 1,4-alpha-galacturonidase